MPDVIDTICDRDDQEAARKRLVGANCQVIFLPLRSALKELVSKYNIRNPSFGIGFPDAMVFKDFPIQITDCGFHVQKTTDPKAFVSLAFDINSGQMEYECRGIVRGRNETIRLDFKDGTPLYQLGATNHSPTTLANELIETSFGQRGFSPERIRA
jgi:hypothetical protein